MCTDDAEILLLFRALLFSYTDSMLFSFEFITREFFFYCCVFQITVLCIPPLLLYYNFAFIIVT